MSPYPFGKIVIISSPSGGGKSSICQRLLESPTGKTEQWSFSVSYTTRRKRPGETEGREYRFVDRETYDRLVDEGFFAEHFSVHGSCYGTPRAPLDQALRENRTMLLDVDYNGALRLKDHYPQAITIFILPPPPAEESLRARLRKRGTESPRDLEIRFRNALVELRQYDRFEYVVINDDLAQAVDQVLSIIHRHPDAAHPCRTENLREEQIRDIIG